MFTHKDDEYVLTKQILKGHADMEPEIGELVNWIARKYSINVLNAIFTPAGGQLKKPRMKIIVESRSEVQLFRNDVNYIKLKQEEIADAFKIIIQKHAASYQCDGLFVVFSAFEPIARMDTDNNLSEEDITKFKQSLNDSELWDISRSFVHVTFMFYTDEQARRKSIDGTRESYSALYLQMLKPYDEFGYVDNGSYTVSFDSKQNLDENFKGSWVNYYR